MEILKQIARQYHRCVRSFNRHPTHLLLGREDYETFLKEVGREIIQHKLGTYNGMVVFMVDTDKLVKVMIDPISVPPERFFAE